MSIKSKLGIQWNYANHNILMIKSPENPGDHSVSKSFGNSRNDGFVEKEKES